MYWIDFELNSYIWIFYWLVFAILFEIGDEIDQNWPN